MIFLWLKMIFFSLLRIFLCGVSCFRSKVGPGQTLRVSLRANIALCLNCTPSVRRLSICPSTQLNMLSSADPIINQWGNAAPMSEPHEHNIQKKKLHAQTVLSRNAQNFKASGFDSVAWPCCSRWWMPLLHLHRFPFTNIILITGLKSAWMQLI